MMMIIMMMIIIIISHILKEPNINDACRKYNEVSGTMQDISAGYQVLAPMECVLRHDQLARFVYQNPATKYHPK
jgi:hypothetical protein